MYTFIRSIYLAFVLVSFLNTATAQRVFVVNSTLDLADNNPGDGVCQWSANICSLRAAIMEANATANLAAGPDEIHFSGLVATPTVITLAIELPDITEAIKIDGSTGPGARVVVDIANDTLNGFSLAPGSDQSEIRGMTIGNGFHAIDIESNNNVIKENFLGTNPNGIDVGNYRGVKIGSGSGNTISHNVIGFGHVGVEISSYGEDNYIRSNFIGVSKGGENRANWNGILSYGDRNHIGGPLPEHGNLIGFNSGSGILLWGASGLAQYNSIGTNAAGDNLGYVPAVGCGIVVRGENATVLDNTIGLNVIGLEIFAADVTVQRNYIGVNAAGFDVGNTLGGMLITGRGSQIGGSKAEGNVIGMNGGYGIMMDPITNLATVQGNYIGTDAAGSDLGNSGDGIVLKGLSTDNVIGYGRTDAISNSLTYANSIAYNENGIVLDEQFGFWPFFNSIRGNHIYENTGLGIDLGDDGTTPNDVDDIDQNANEQQNHPDITRAWYNAGRDVVAVEYSVTSSDPSVLYPLNIDIYLADDASSGAGKTYIGTDVYTTANTVERFDIDAASVVWSSTDRVVLTATDADGNTSEFSPVSDELGGPGNSASLANWHDALQLDDKPEALRVVSAYPNPFNPQTTISLELPEASHVRVTVHNMLGRQVAQLHNDNLAAGISHTFTFDAPHLSSGVYLLRVAGEGFLETQKLVLLK